MRSELCCQSWVTAPEFYRSHPSNPANLASPCVMTCGELSQNSMRTSAAAEDCPDSFTGLAIITRGIHGAEPVDSAAPLHPTVKPHHITTQQQAQSWGQSSSGDTGDETNTITGNKACSIPHTANPMKDHREHCRIELRFRANSAAETRPSTIPTD